MSRDRIAINISPKLFRDVRMCARQAKQEPQDFLVDVIESYIAQRRLDGNIPKPRLAEVTHGTGERRVQ